MQTLTLVPDMDVVNELSSNQYCADYALALEVKQQVQAAEQYGGLQKVAICKVTKKRANLLDNTVELTVEEAVITADRRGKQTHDCIIGADSAAEAIHICNATTTYCTHIAINRRDGAIIAYWRD